MSNLFKSKLKGSRIGVFFLTGAPMHLGHYQAIVQAKRENDGCIVVFSGSKGDRGDAIGLPLQKRFRYGREMFADDKEVFVTYVDESNIPSYPNGWEPWLNLVTQAMSHTLENTVDTKFVWYVGEEEYNSTLIHYLNPDFHEVKMLERSILPISGTLVRENPLKYWNYIARPFRRHFSFNILVAGAASSGKSTLVRDLARSFSTSFSEEYAREYEELSNIADDELIASDFQYLASGMFKSNQAAMHSPANQGVVFCDTSVGVTEVYSELYLTEEEHQALLPSYNMLKEQERWDYIIFVPPYAEYINDGFRDMSHSEDSKRWEIYDRMVEVIEAQNPDVPTNSLDMCDFDTMYNQARELVKYRVHEKQGIDLDQRVLGTI